MLAHAAPCGWQRLLVCWHTGGCALTNKADAPCSWGSGGCGMASPSCPDKLRDERGRLKRDLEAVRAERDGLAARRDDGTAGRRCAVAAAEEGNDRRREMITRHTEMGARRKREFEAVMAGRDLLRWQLWSADGT